MSRKALIVLYSILDVIFVAIIVIGLMRGKSITSLLPAIIIVALSNMLWLMFALRKQR
jgi:hypothetical protein